MKKIIFGVDLGKKGGLVVLSGNRILDKKVMPLQANDIDVIAIARFLKLYHKGNSHIIFEKFSGFFGYSKMAAVSLAMQSGKIQTICTLLKIPFTSVMPQVWQKEMWQGTKIQFKKVKNIKKKDTKKTSLLTVMRLFPGENFLASDRCKKFHDGLVDAALLAEYCKRKGF